jgi:MYND finger
VAQSVMPVTQIAAIVYEGNERVTGYCPLPEIYYWSQKVKENSGGPESEADHPYETVIDACICCGSKRSVAKLRRCAQCQTFAYCGKACQAIHWKNGHKADCNRVKDLKNAMHTDNHY